VVGAWLPLELEPPNLARAVTAWAAAYLASTRARSIDDPAATVRGQRAAELLGQVSFSAVGGRAVGYLRHQAVSLDHARTEAVALARAAAESAERQRQHRIIHDSALQVLEAVSGSWTVDDELLTARVDYEVRRLERWLAGGWDHEPLAGQLDALVEEFALIGLDVVVDRSSLDGATVSAPALAEATHEVLMNVHKHAGVRAARVIASASDAHVEVRVEDDGCGFDPLAPRLGFGLDESVRRRVSDAGGDVTIVSRAGAGTRVTMRMPA
jgi:signal transduction histidine kinase